MLERYRRGGAGTPAAAEAADAGGVMLARVRAALGRDDSAAAPRPLAPFDDRDQAAAGEPGALGGEDLAARFALELERVGGHFARAGTAREVCAYLLRLLPAGGGGEVALSDASLLRELGLRELLAGAGVGLVSTPDPELRDAGREGGRLDALLRADVGVTCADYALADTGTVVLVSGAESHRLASLLPPAHVCLLRPEQLLPRMASLFEAVGGGYLPGARAPQAMTCITGPSRTADIEQTITLGVHGPRSLHVLLYAPAA